MDNLKQHVDSKDIEMGATNLTHFTSRYTINQRFLESPDWKGFARFVLVTHLLGLRNQWMRKGRALELGREKETRFRKKRVTIT